MNISLLDVDPQKAIELDSMLLNGERMRLLSAAKLRQIDAAMLQAWAVLRGRYSLITSELIEWLRQAIDGKDSLEVGAGMGDIGYHLGIPQSDSAIQTKPSVKMQMMMLGQPITVPPADVFREEAVDSVKKRKPQVVVASWLSQFSMEGKGSPYGADEEEILRHVERYIFVGNMSVHHEKRIMRHPHQMFKFDWLVSRAHYQQDNFIAVWKGIK